MRRIYLREMRDDGRRRKISPHQLRKIESRRLYSRFKSRKSLNPNFCLSGPHYGVGLCLLGRAIVFKILQLIQL